MAYALQTQPKKKWSNLYAKQLNKVDVTNVVISGGYGLNCVAN